MVREVSLRERVLGGLYGAIVGDALGVPVEFTSREERKKDPVTDMRGHQTHNQPPGTWSDDSSLILCTVESLLNGFDLKDMGQRFVRWYREGHWAPGGKVFDIGGMTRSAIIRLSRGTDTRYKQPTLETIKEILDKIDGAINQGKSVYIHCWGGRGRTGTVVGCWLMRHGKATAEDVLSVIQQLRRNDPTRFLPSPENKRQEWFVKSWKAGQ